jgi:PA14 domain
MENNEAAIELARQSELRAQVCSSANAAGVGLRGEYYARPAWKGVPELVRTDSTIDFDSTLEWPASLTHAPRSIRWQGWVKAPISGLYRFHADPGGTRIEVAKSVVAGAPSSAHATLEMSAGRFYPIIVAIEDVDSAQRFRLEWTLPHGGRSVIPRALLFLPTT